MNRRKFLTGMLAAPLVVKAEILMPVQSVFVPGPREIYGDSLLEWVDPRILYVNPPSDSDADRVPIKELPVFRKISDALNASRKGDTIFIMPGEYREEMSV